MKSINTEKPDDHWRYIDVKDKVVLDIGCGRWEKVEYRDQSWPTTPEYFVLKGASKVYGIDIDNEEINWYKHMFKDDDRYKFTTLPIQSNETLEKLIVSINPNCIKCDIEGEERHLLNTSKEIFCLVDEYYIETHSDSLFDQLQNLLINYNYKIREIISLEHTNNTCKVIFATKI